MKSWDECQKTKLKGLKDRRRALTEKDKGKIREMKKEGFAIREIARQYKAKCSRRLIQFILYPERAERNAEHYKERGQAQKTYARIKGKKWASIMREHRMYKYKVLKLK